MRRFAVFIVCVLTILCLAACGEEKSKESSDSKNTESEIAMVTQTGGIDDGGFNQVTWEEVKRFCEEKDMTYAHYGPKEQSEEGYLAAVAEAVDNKAKVVIMCGSGLETAVHTAQSTYPDVYFLIIDGVPHDASNNYAMGANTASVIFAEEEAGYLAGYAAVKDGYTKLGFMGGQETPAIKRYGYGFVQGAAAAAGETEKKVSMRYVYTGTYDESDEVRSSAASWYKDGTEVIFACGGAMGRSVIKAAENNNGKVIGVDVDQSGVSETVITSAEKGLGSAVENILKSYERGSFPGGSAFNYTARNDGVSLEMENSRFNSFSQDDYKKTFRALKNGETELKKDTDVDSVTQLAGQWLTIAQ